MIVQAEITPSTALIQDLIADAAKRGTSYAAILMAVSKAFPVEGPAAEYGEAIRNLALHAQYVAKGAV